VWDTSPILAVVDAAVLAPLVDGVLLVAARDHTSGRQLDLALDALANVGVRPIGTVFNRAESDSADGYYYRDYHEHRDSPLPRAERKGVNGNTPEISPETARQASLLPPKRTN
jgi:receptor protein-tyrosine kinase